MLSAILSNREIVRTRKLLGVTKRRGKDLSDVKFLQKSFDQAGLSKANRLKFLKLSAVGLIVSLASGLLIGFDVGVVLGFLVVGLAFIFLKSAGFKRALAFEKDYPAFLLSLRSAVRTGHDPLIALEHSVALFPSDSVVRSEIAKVVKAVEEGKTEDEAIGLFASSIPHPDVALFRTGFLLSRKQGSSLAPCLERLVKTTRQRQSFRRKIASAVAMQKLSSFGVAGCALFVPVMQFITAPDDLTAAFDHPVGGTVIVIGAGLVVFGFVWMLSMSRQKL